MGCPPPRHHEGFSAGVSTAASGGRRGLDAPPPSRCGSPGGPTSRQFTTTCTAGTVIRPRRGPTLGEGVSEKRTCVRGSPPLAGHIVVTFTARLPPQRLTRAVPTNFGTYRIHPRAGLANAGHRYPTPAAPRKALSGRGPLDRTSRQCSGPSPGHEAGGALC